MSTTSDQDGLTENDVATLYRWLLGRPPESPGTVQAFRSYYPDIGRGRRAVFESDEFQRFYAGVTGRQAAAQDAPGALALAFLRRAGGMAAGDEAGVRPALQNGMRMMLRAMGGAGLALVLGMPDAALADLAPLEAGAAVLHVAPDFPAFVPHMGAQGGATLFRVALDAAGLVAFLHRLGLRIGLLAVLGPPGEPALLEAVHPFLAPQAVVVAGDAAAADTVRAWRAMQALPPWMGYAVFHAGGWHLPVAYAPPEGTPALPNAEEYPALAVACIARNERNSIGHMLHSVLPIVSFVAVLDTGSSDDTMAQARSVLEPAGKPCVVACRPMERFDDMRNAALDMVPDWVEWILMLDADEALAPEDFQPLLTLLRHAGKHAYALPRYNYIGIEMQGDVTPYPDRQIRLLRNRGQTRPRYTGAVHETVHGVEAGLPPLDAAVLGLGRGGPHIHHLVRRFRTPEEEARKQEYYRDLAARLGG